MMRATKSIEEPDVVLYMDPIPVGWSGVPHRDKGFANFELTSVCNTLVQVLMHVPSFVHWMLKSQHEISCPAKESCLLCATISLRQQLDSQLIVRPEQFCELMNDASDDAHEVMRDILLMLHANVMSVYSSLVMSTWSERTSPIFQMFGGLWKVSASCCGTTFQPFLSIEVPLVASSLQVCLDGLGAKNICKICKSAVKSVMTVHSAPTVLIINLGRLLGNGSFCDKEIIIPPDIILQERFSYRHLSTVFASGGHIDNVNYSALTSCPNGILHVFTDASFKRVNAASLLGDPKYLKSSYMAVYELRKEIKIVETMVTEEHISKAVPEIISSSTKESTPFSARVTSTQKKWDVSPISVPNSTTGTRKRKQLIFEENQLNSMNQGHDEGSPITLDRSAATTTSATTTSATATTINTATCSFATASTWTTIPSCSIGTQTTTEQDENRALRATSVLSLAKCWTQSATEFRFFTGLTQENFCVLYKLLGGDDVFSKLKMDYKLSTPSKNEKKLKLPLQDRLFLTLIRLRRGTPLRDLGFVMGISQSQASEIFYAVLRHMYLTFQHFKERMLLTVEQQKKKMPKVFKPFKNLRVIIDGAEFKLQVPSNFQQQGNTYSDYKACNTAHFIIGINLHGGISFVSKAYEGAISDKQATLDSSLLDMLQPGDALMVDRGFELKAECMMKKITLLRPPSLGQRDKFTPKEVLLTKAIAKARIYVEHAIGKIKDFRLLRYTIPNKMIPYMEDMVYVCACLTNFDPPRIKTKPSKKTAKRKAKKPSQKPAKKTKKPSKELVETKSKKKPL
ncbi:Ubiquitin carboxyl-terminal hydrolase 36 [Frankliniella fusca]|uniref:Ubiquitin carboxyl-terminal hydrolase 36 n=1 Tax=Frankliniella fusca TaxID=407009 RepID=A0AAE1HFM5_9NEOP|nr:Ubiquitin carboxyl-terminal hydrolase 36 [Frankliniella fusca]